VRFRSSETKNDMSSAPRPKSFVSDTKLKKKATTPSSSPDKDVFCSSETQNDRRTAPSPMIDMINFGASKMTRKC
jgi:hypothetical protein